MHRPGFYVFLVFLPVCRDDAGSPIDEGAGTGEWLTVLVNGVHTGQRVQWTALGAVTRLDIQAVAAAPVPAA